MKQPSEGVKGDRVLVVCGYCRVSLGEYDIDGEHVDDEAVEWSLQLPHDESAGGWRDGDVWRTEGDRAEDGSLLLPVLDHVKVDGRKTRALLHYRCVDDEHRMFWFCPSRSCRKVRSVADPAMSRLIDDAIARRVPILLR